jgi:hypothetical protein
MARTQRASGSVRKRGSAGGTRRRGGSARARKRPTPSPGVASTAKGVKRLKASQFAYPKTREYPINTAKRARAALAYSARSTTSGSYGHVLGRIKASRNPAVRAVGVRSAKRGR